MRARQASPIFRGRVVLMLNPTEEIYFFSSATPDSVFLLLIYQLFPRHKFRINFMETPAVPILAITLVFFLLSRALLVRAPQSSRLTVWHACLGDRMGRRFHVADQQAGREMKPWT